MPWRMQKTDIKESDEWQKAVAYEITDEDIERQRKLLGFDQAAEDARIYPDRDRG
jgi:hypothetical protein